MGAKQHRNFFQIPQTRLGGWAVGLTVSYAVLFVFTNSGFLPSSGLLTMVYGVVAGILTLMAIIWRCERSWLVWLMLLPGLFTFLLILGAILFQL